MIVDKSRLRSLIGSERKRLLNCSQQLFPGTRFGGLVSDSA